MSKRCVVIGPGRAGGSFHLALSEVGWTAEPLEGRSIDLDRGPRRRPRPARRPRPGDRRRRGPHPIDCCRRRARLGSLRPRRARTAPPRRLDPPADVVARPRDREPSSPRPLHLRCRRRPVDDGGRSPTSAAGAIHVPGPKRALYHAAAAIAANHLTALCAQVESLAAEVGVPVDAYWTLMSDHAREHRQVSARPQPSPALPPAATGTPSAPTSLPSRRTTTAASTPPCAKLPPTSPVTRRPLPSLDIGWFVC